MGVNIEEEVNKLLGPESPWARAHGGYEPRPAQWRMATGVIRTIAEPRVFLVEAGTGTGKTVAYLLPLLSRSSKAIISTATKALQDQIMEQELPKLQAALGANLNVALLKGRANYLCLYRLRQFRTHYPLLRGADRRWFEVLDRWSNTSSTGDRDEINGLPESLPMWGALHAGGERCLGKGCPDYDDCFLLKARERALKARLVVVNHHLFFADLSLKEEGFGELLPKCDLVVFDEAHQLPDVVTRFFCWELSNFRLMELARDTRAEFQEAADDTRVSEAATVLEEAATVLRNAFPAEDNKKGLEPEDMNREPGRALIKCESALQELMQALEPHRSRGTGIAACGRRAEELLEVAGHLRTLDDPERAYWWESRGKGILLQAAPLSVADTLKDNLFPRFKSLIFTSATLATSQGADAFQYQIRQLGCEPEKTATEQLATSFDWSRQTLLYVPGEFVEPDHPSYPQAVAEELKRLLQASRGRALCLFTSFRMLEGVRQELLKSLPYPLLWQGQSAKRELLDQFRREEASVLLGTGTFWEGVDVPGAALSLVVVDRLPFPSPGDPLIAARSRYIRHQGGDPFRDLSLPKAVLTLKQGLGRLLRRKDDRGAMAILDVRFMNRPYGRQFRAGLPPVRITRDLEEMRRFFHVDPPPQG
ncbi:MAG: ATP-dependent DNA helicase [Magnetococcales bacterium]|nr:ATP-dependent DNA helicase [Magnetococcales bacterium]